MKTLKRLFAATLSLASFVAHAGVPVIDEANLSQQILQMAQWVEQIDSMYAQIDNQVEQIQKATDIESRMSGLRDYGSLLNSAAYQQARAYLEADWEDTVNALDDLENLPAQVESLIQSNALYSYEEMGIEDDPTVAPALKPAQAVAALDQSTSGAVIEATNARAAELQTLIDEINNSPDLKSSVDLQARIMAEQLMLTNEMIANQAQYRLIDAQRGVTDTQQYETQLMRNHITFDPVAHMQEQGFDYAFEGE